MTDKQQGWNDALNIVFDQFNYVAWQKGLGQERKKAAEDIKKRVWHKFQEKSEDDYQQTMLGVVKPFCKELRGESQPEQPFITALPEAERQGRNDALEIILDTFKGFAQRKDLQLEWTCSETATDMKKRVEFEVRERSQAYLQAMVDMVRPFYEMLKGEPQRQPPFDT